MAGQSALAARRGRSRARLLCLSSPAHYSITSSARATTEPGHTELGTKAAEGAGVGAAVGGGLGAVLAGLAAAGVIAPPGIGLIAMGPIAAALTGGAIGAAGGGLLGALIGYGIPEEQARRYETGIREGNIVMGVTPRSEDDAAYFEHEWRNARGEDIYWPVGRERAA